MLEVLIPSRPSQTETPLANKQLRLQSSGDFEIATVFAFGEVAMSRFKRDCGDTFVCFMRFPRM
jgi:hypothetical protein